mmetsp:Transcript_15342/g.46026  ORF Transcript_15342/g.46026 Transcript_15342/m.46026 type:complete len:217 (+) Transcript_15342:182-832(+)
MQKSPAAPHKLLRGAPRSGKSRRKKFHKVKAGLCGSTKKKRGSPYAADTITQCARCHRGQHRRCERIEGHCWAAERSPNGIVKKEQARAKKRTEKAAAKAAVRALQLEPEKSSKPPEWEQIKPNELWMAIATDNIGHHDGECAYRASIPVEDFGDKLYLSGDVRLGMNGSSLDTIFKLPSVAPPPGSKLTYIVPVCPQGAKGRLALVSKVEVRAAA